MTRLTLPSHPVLAAVTALAAGACAIPGTSTISRTAPPETAVETERVVEGDREEAWDRLVAALSSEPFTVEDANRTAGIVEATFSAPDPERWIDCGTTTRTYRRGSDRQSWTYPLAAASSYRWAMALGSHDEWPVTYEIDRDTDLRARVRARLDPGGSEAGAVRVGVGARYTLSIAVTGDFVMEATNGVPIDQGPVVPQSYEVTFRTNQPNWTDLGTEEDPVWVSCVSKGTLEERVLEIAAGAGEGI